MKIEHGSFVLLAGQLRLQTHSEYVILIAFPRQQWCYVIVIVTFILHCLFCYCTYKIGQFGTLVNNNKFNYKMFLLIFIFYIFNLLFCLKHVQAACTWSSLMMGPEQPKHVARYM